MQNPFQHQAITAVHREKPFLLADGCVFEQVSTFFGLKLRQLIGKVRVLSCSPPAWEALDTSAPQLVSNAFENHMVILVNMPFFVPTMRKRSFQRTIRSYFWQWCAVSILTSKCTQAQSLQNCHWLVACQLLLWDNVLKILMFHPWLHWIWPFWITRMRTSWLKMLFWAYLVLIFPVFFSSFRLTTAANYR